MDGEVCQVFNGSNISIYIDSENAISAVYLNHSYVGDTKMVDFDTVIPFNSIEDFEAKEWYTGEEIDSIVPQVVQSNQKIKELENKIYK